MADSGESKREVEVVVVTGASQGIGRAIADLYVARGARVAGIDLKPPAGASGTASAIDWHACDVTDEAAMLACAAKIRQSHGAPTVWINNAGIAKVGAFEKLSTADFKRVVDVCLYGVVHGTRAALSVMSSPARGTIANVASVNGAVPAPFMTPYVTAKHGVVGFTRALAEEMRQVGSPLKVSLVLPGFVKTGIMEGHADFEFPQAFQWMISTPESTAREIADGIDRGDAEIRPTLNGKMFLTFNRVAPGALVKSTRLFTARNWKELLGLNSIRR